MGVLDSIRRQRREPRPSKVKAFATELAIKYGELGNQEIRIYLGTVAREFAMDRDSVKNYLDEAVNLGMLNLIKPGRRLSNGTYSQFVYRVNLNWSDVLADVQGGGGS